MKKRSILKIGAITLCLALILFGTAGAMNTGAWFSDTAASMGNTITAGTLDLTVDDNNDAVLEAVISAEDLAPGAWDNLGHATITNIGTLPGQLSFKVKDIVNKENGGSALEVAAGDNTRTGDLGQKIALSIQENSGSYDRYDSMSNFADGAVLSTQGRVLQPGDSIQVIYYVTWTPTANDNIAQSDSVEFNLEINLDQIRP